MSRLKGRIVRLIEAAGPISVSDYMALCLADPQDGYYMTRDPFGRDGDFVTAPEVSQMFGELVGAWITATWHAAGAPQPVTLAEIGPGRGTLMQDLLRTLVKIAPQLVGAASVVLIETSPKLRAVQEAALRDAPVTVRWLEDVAELPPQPTIIVGNELFDAIPLRQYVRTEAGWRERVVGLDEGGKLFFMAGAGSLDPALLPAAAAHAPVGAIVEIAPARAALMQKIAGRIADHGGAGLFIDYGHVQPGVGDTLQALRKHAHDDPLAHPGEADLTAHVDFAALADAARLAGLQAQILTQGEFLLRLGLLERAGALGANTSEAIRERLSGEVQRLAGPEEMGGLFKVLAIAQPAVTLPGFDRSG